MSDNLQQQELDQIADDVRSNLTKSVEHIINCRKISFFKLCY